MTLQPTAYPRHRFPTEIINHAVWLYHVFSLILGCIGRRLSADEHAPAQDRDLRPAWHGRPCASGVMTYGAVRRPPPA